VILVHRLKGEPLFVNADLIESVEALPDTVVTLVDGRKAVVAESPEQVVEQIRAFRASVLVAAEELRTVAPAPNNLVLLPSRAEDE
jgi:flagellar protein FlbD